MAHPLRAYLDKRDISISKFADEVDIQRSTISRVLSGERGRFSISAALKIAKHTGLSVDELLSLPSGTIASAQARKAKGGRHASR